MKAITTTTLQTTCFKFDDVLGKAAMEEDTISSELKSSETEMSKQ